ncbi:MAG: hypothetical protein K0R14_52 [Burkholderiales bacterium]|jgi:MFS family permease|nr:hypothetical protein [Burkholderiales bacterium]
MKKTYFIILVLLISFASIGAVMVTPGLPEISSYFKLSNIDTNLTITWYLIGYAFGQLIYGPLTNRFGSILTIKIGAIIATAGCIGCILSYYTHSYFLLVASRCLMALGAACGLKMTFTICSKLFAHEESARLMGLLTMAFAVTPGLGIYLGGVLVTFLNWTAVFYFMVSYGIAIFLLSSKLPEMYTSRDYLAITPKHILKNYIRQLKAREVIFGGLLIGVGTCIVYIFAAVSPFIAIKEMHLTPSVFGVYNFIPCFGMLIGALASNYYGKIWLPQKSLKFGLITGFCGVIVLTVMLYFKPSMPISLFFPMVIIYFGFSFIFGNAAAIALLNVKDKGNASAIISFINMLSAFVLVSITGFFNITTPFMLPIIYLILIGAGFIWYNILCYK